MSTHTDFFFLKKHILLKKKQKLDVCVPIIFTLCATPSRGQTGKCRKRAVPGLVVRAPHTHTYCMCKAGLDIGYNMAILLLKEKKNAGM